MSSRVGHVVSRLVSSCPVWSRQVGHVVARKAYGAKTVGFRCKLPSKPHSNPQHSTSKHLILKDLTVLFTFDIAETYLLN